MKSFRLEGWTVQPDRNRIVRGRVKRILQSREMELLTRLAEGKGAVVSKEELLRDVWQDQCVVEHVIPKTVSSLRKLLGESAQHARIVQTIPKRGYRLACEVSDLRSPWMTRWRPPLPLAAVAALGWIVALPVLTGTFPVSGPDPLEQGSVGKRIALEVKIVEEYDFEWAINVAVETDSNE